MDVFSMVALVVTVSVFGGVLTKYLQTKAELASRDDNSRIDLLEQRVVALEKIVTDRRESLRNHIDQL